LLLRCGGISTPGRDSLQVQQHHNNNESGARQVDVSRLLSYLATAVVPHALPAGSNRRQTLHSSQAPQNWCVLPISAQAMHEVR
jgi:hypothetical protein